MPARVYQPPDGEAVRGGLAEDLTASGRESLRNGGPFVGPRSLSVGP